MNQISTSCKNANKIYMALIVEPQQTYPAPKADRIVYKDECTYYISLNEYYNLESSGSNVDSLLKNLLSTYYDLEIIKPQLKLPKEQINALKNDIGFNISEIAAILNVRRPTVYEWLEAEIPNLRDNNRKRLDEIYSIVEKWEKTNLGRLDAYLRKTIIDNKSLFDLLSSKKINHALVDEALILLEQIIKKANEVKKLSIDFITKHNLEESTKKHKERKLKQHRSIG